MFYQIYFFEENITYINYIIIITLLKKFYIKILFLYILTLKDLFNYKKLIPKKQ